MLTYQANLAEMFDIEIVKEETQKEPEHKEK